MRLLCVILDDAIATIIVIRIYNIVCAPFTLLPILSPKPDCIFVISSQRLYVIPCPIDTYAMNFEMTQFI